METLLEEIALHLSSMASDSDVSSGIEQALFDVVVALEKMKSLDGVDIVKAIKGLKLSVTVNPTPVTVSVQPTPVEIIMPPVQKAEAFKPLRFQINRNTFDGRTESIDVFEVK